MTKGVVLGVVLTIVVALIGGYCLILSGLIPANADAKPGRLESWMAHTSLRATLNRDAPKDPNPVALTDQNLLDGLHLYADHCGVCHGTAKGAASISPIAKGFYQEAPQLASDGVEDDADGVTFWKVKHGIRLTGMPSFTQSLSDKQIWTVALFLKHMDKLPPKVAHPWEQVRNWPATPVSQPVKK